MNPRDASAEHFVAGSPSIVYVVDDDRSIRLTLGSLLLSVGYQVEAFESVAAFLEFDRPDTTSCLVLDIRLRGENGLVFQRECHRFHLHMPILFVSGHGDIAMSVQAMKAGAVNFLEKPFRDQDLLDAVHDALARDYSRRSSEQRLKPLRASYGRLSAREREVLHLVVTGLLNKQIAATLGVSEDCVKLHRSQVMKKMGSRSVPDLVRKARDLGITPRC
ncbi:response regulator transcription factor [Paraburkholderia rhizosphaerae]|uniref:response regulator transcription factor n=1 Tax=Paraburkholderia rhizosphaerae TaxID=480658 RepID=UPI001FB8C524|nr:response regulator [Paraburkholderia rhizosphaerae]